MIKKRPEVYFLGDEETESDAFLNLSSEGEGNTF
jgi:hypothetical protein